MSYKEIFKWVAKTMLSSIIWLSIFGGLVTVAAKMAGLDEFQKIGLVSCVVGLLSLFIKLVWFQKEAQIEEEEKRRSLWQQTISES